MGTHFDRGIQVYLALVIGNIDLLWGVEYRALT